MTVTIPSRLQLQLLLQLRAHSPFAGGSSTPRAVFQKDKSLL